MRTTSMGSSPATGSMQSSSRLGPHQPKALRLSSVAAAVRLFSRREGDRPCDGAEGNTLAAENTFTSTNTGPLTLASGQTLPATNKKVSLRGVYVVTLEGERVKSDHSYWDLAEGLAQLGLMPTPATATA